MSKTSPPKKKRSFLRILSGLLTAFVVVDLFVWLLSDPVAHFAVERGASYALGVDTTVDELDIGILSGRTRITSLTVANPEGFDSPHFFQLEGGRVDVALGSLWRDKIVVPQLSFSGIRVNLEQKGPRSNYKVILDHLSQFHTKAEPADADPQEKPSKTPQKPPSETKEQQFVIERLSIKDIRVEISLSATTGRAHRIPIEINRIELENIGSNQDGSLIMNLTGIVIKSILTRVVQEAGGHIPDLVLKDLGQGLGQLEELGRTNLKITSDLQKQVDEVGEQIDTASEEIGQQFEEVGKKIGQGLDDLFHSEEKE